MNNTATYTCLGTNGRFANQLFQIAATIAYAIDNNKSFAFPLWEYSRFMHTPLPEESIAPHTPLTFYREPHLHYSHIPAIPGNVDLFGYFQSEKYFVHRKKEILPYLTINHFLQESIRDYYRDILNQFTCSIHVRRSDYTTETNRDYHGLMPVEYYEVAAQTLFGNDTDNVLFVICSDDIPWCKQAFSFKNMVFIENETNIKDLFIMSYCQNHIIANSSFSWWSAWLGINPARRVVSPKKWFNNAKSNELPDTPINSSDIHCDGWIVI